MQAKADVVNVDFAKRISDLYRSDFEQSHLLVEDSLDA